jgi:hypothetical protein
MAGSVLLWLPGRLGALAGALLLPPARERRPVVVLAPLWVEPVTGGEQSRPRGCRGGTAASPGVGIAQPCEASAGRGLQDPVPWCVIKGAFLAPRGGNGTLARPGGH